MGIVRKRVLEAVFDRVLCGWGIVRIGHCTDRAFQDGVLCVGGLMRMGYYADGVLCGWGIMRKVHIDRLPGQRSS